MAWLEGDLLSTWVFAYSSWMGFGSENRLNTNLRKNNYAANRSKMHWGLSLKYVLLYQTLIGYLYSWSTASLLLSLYFVSQLVRHRKTKVIAEYNLNKKFEVSYLRLVRLISSFRSLVDPVASNPSLSHGQTSKSLYIHLFNRLIQNYPICKRSLANNSRLVL